MEAADFSGYATKAGIKCTDGRTITAEAFKHMDGMTVPLVWQHGHNSAENVLGHVLLKARKDGVYCYGYFNKTKQGQDAKELVQHKDIDSLSIFANQLVEKAKQVLHGVICEVSLVLRGANSGAKIDYIAIQHGDGDVVELEDEAIIHTGLNLEFEQLEGTEEVVEHAEGDDQTMQEVYDSLSDVQKDVVHYMIGTALEQAKEEAAAEHSATGEGTNTVDSTSVDGATTAEGAPAEGTTPEGDLTHQEGNTVVNLFDQVKAATRAAQAQGERHVLTHDAMKGIFAEAQESKSLKTALKSYMLAHGIDSIDTLFPEARAIADTPEFDKRRTEWVSVVLNGVRKTPFAKIKTLSADLTQAAARAKGYIKGSLKKEEWFGLTKRTTGPTTIYKKQSLDRDDILDITEMDVVAWLWVEMRFMLEEEIARAILVGDGRDVEDEDHISDPMGTSSGDGIRSILNDHDYYAMTVNTNLDDASSSWLEFVDNVIMTRRFYKGSGMPTMFTTEYVIGKLLTIRSELTGQRLFRTLDELATELRVERIVPVEVMEDHEDVLAILVNLRDYNVGTNKGGDITRFDDFDIDYNKYKYLLETRLSGALVKLKSALIYKKVAGAAALVVPNDPTFVSSTGVVTIVATTGVVYKNKETGATLSTGAQAALDPGASVTVVATPASASYYLADNVEDEWTFTRDEA